MNFVDKKYKEVSELYSTELTENISVIFHEMSSDPSVGLIVPVANYNLATVEISGLVNSVTILFEGSIGGEFVPIVGYNIETLEINNGTTGVGEIWQIDLSGMSYFRVRIHQITGSVRVEGRLTV